MLAASTARMAGTPSGTGTTASSGTVNRLWCGCSDEHQAPQEVARARFHPADHDVAVLDGNGNAPAMNGARMRSYSLSGTRPKKTSRSVPRLSAP